jgi:mono/diheme cytochrome c family protein
MTMTIRMRLTLMLSAGALAAALIPAAAQDGGDAAKGRALARQQCVSCHGIERGDTRSPNDSAPLFSTVASVPGMTALALQATLQTSHRDMPNIILQAEDRLNIVAYILSLKSP